MTVTHGVSATRGGTTCETAGHGRGRQGQLPEAKASPGTPGEHGRLWGTGPQGHQAPWEAAPRSGGAVSRDVQAGQRPLPWQNLPGTRGVTQPGCAEPRPLPRISDASLCHASSSREPLGSGSPLLNNKAAVASGKSRHCLNLQLLLMGACSRAHTVGREG